MPPAVVSDCGRQGAVTATAAGPVAGSAASPVPCGGRLTGLRHWLLVRGTVLLIAFVALYVANGLVIGWKTTYDVTIGITSPGDA